MDPLTPLDLLSIPLESRVTYEDEVRANEMKRTHEYVRGHIEKANAAYKARANKHLKYLDFKPRDLVWLHLMKERFPSRWKNKLSVSSNGPFQVIEKVGDNADKL